MEAAISAVATEIFSRVISFLTQRYRDKTQINEKLERMQQLLLRIHAVVEEAEGRYITNPIMLRQLKCLAESMYQGYHILDIFRYKSFVETIANEEVKTISSQLTTFSPVPFKRSRSISHTRRSCAKIYNLRSVLENLEAAIASINEFVVLLGGCDRCFRRPYDMYLYTDNIMFGRHVEKQQVINILLQDPEEHGTPTVLPIIGGCRVGKKTLVNYVCQNERIKSYFSSIMFLNGYNISRMDTGKLQDGRVLAVIEFVTDVNDDDWVKFYSTVKHTACDGSKVIIISRIQNLVRFGTVKTLHLNSLTHQEYKYLFRMLAFGSIDEKDYPQLVAVASELAIVLGGSLITANIIADLLRRNLDVKFWFRILQRFKAMVDNNLSMFGEHPKDILENERPIDITTFNSSHPSSLHMMPPRVARDDDSSERKLYHVSFADLVAGTIALPKNQFILVGWESRLPPYTKFVSDVACYEKRQCSVYLRKRRSII
ncbi:hypothetical protein HU200_002423 [Digitaria exilis]|uniref:Disease resistance N-terminal domain-containing protein n=1 Tax=Digitaria exilis TaxID=1010633 RepID=A0A835KWU2_9POAL|nr:hypothetical protein HU200_002423 [Digitaria exilis]